MAALLMSKDARTKADLEVRWKAQTARVAAAGGSLVVELRTLAEIWQQADAAFPGAPQGAGPRALGLELPGTFVNHFLGGPNWAGLFEQWKDEARRRGYLDR